MACCDWNTFTDAFLGAWRKARHNPSPLLIDWRQAEHQWRRHHCTGGEAACVQLKALSAEANFLWVSKATHTGSERAINRESEASPLSAKLIADELLDRLAERGKR